MEDRNYIGNIKKKNLKTNALSLGEQALITEKNVIHSDVHFKELYHVVHLNSDCVINETLCSFIYRQ